MTLAQPQKINPASPRYGNKAQVAEFFDVSLPTVEAWLRKGMPIMQRGSKGVAWVVDLCAAAQWRFGSQSSGGDIDPDELEPIPRKAWYEGEAKKRELQIKDGELIPVGEVERAVATAFSAIASDILAIPDHLERRYGVGADVAAQVGELLADGMDALADRLSTLSPVGEGAQE